MQVVYPSKNPLNGGYTTSHKAYDHDDVPLKEYYASFSGKVMHITNDFTNSWTANTPGDPWYKPGVTRPLRTDDYGNFIKILGDNGITQLAAHFPKNGFLVKVGDRVQAGQKIAIPPDSGNDTGNSTGGHTHTEYRNSQGVNIEVEFIEGQQPMPNTLLTYLGVPTESDAKERLKVHLGEHDDVSEWGNEEGDRGGFLGAARRDTKRLQAEVEELKLQIVTAKQQGYDEGFAAGLAQSGSPSPSPTVPEGYAVERIAVEEQLPSGKRTTTYIPKN